MHPRLQSMMRAPIRRLQPLGTGVVATFALLAWQPALAQDGDTPDVVPVEVDGDQRADVPPSASLPSSGPSSSGPSSSDTAQDNLAVDFEADELGYDRETDTISASGNVVLRSGDRSMRADAVSWNRLSGNIIATGNVRFVDENGNQLFTDRLELSDQLKAGAMTNLLLAFREGARLAAVEGRRGEDGDVILEQAVYSACPVSDAQGCPKSPSWRITARRVYYDSDSKQVRFVDAFLELFGQRILPLPGLVVRTDGGASSGFLVPDLGLTASNGVEVSSRYYLRLADNRDLTLAGYVYTEAAPMAYAQYRELAGNGALQISGYATYGTRIPLNSAVPTAERDLRGYMAANGRYRLGAHWQLSSSVRIATDRTFLRRYDLSRDDRLRSTANLERIDDNSYFSIAGWVTQALLVQQPQGLVPVALPVIDYRHRSDDPLFGGKVEMQLNSLAIMRDQGQDTQRAFARLQWDLRRITPLGQEVTLTAMMRGDVYHSDENLVTSTASYRGLAGWQTRSVSVAALDIKWPFVGSFLGGTQVFTPRAQFVASPSIKNLEIPNEDARAIDLEDSNLFALNRFPGYDRVEDGARLTYGADWQFELPGWRFKATIGQSYRLSDKPTLFPDGTGLTEKFSDFVGRTELRFRNFVKFTHRYRVDKDDFSIRRNEVDATIGSDRSYIEVGYLRLNRDIDLDFEDLQDREELRAAGRVAFAKYWSLFGSAVVNLTNKSEDATLVADGFEPLRTRLGIAYADDCLEFGLTWRRDYISLADAKRGDSFRLHFSLRKLGVSR